MSTDDPRAKLFDPHALKDEPRKCFGCGGPEYPHCPTCYPNDPEPGEELTNLEAVVQRLKLEAEQREHPAPKCEPIDYPTDPLEQMRVWADSHEGTWPVALRDLLVEHKKLKTELSERDQLRAELANERSRASHDMLKNKDLFDTIQQLRGELAEANGRANRFQMLVIERDKQLDRAKEDAQTERMRLAGCGVVAGQNTPKSAADRLDKNDPYWSSSYGDVCAAVDREMALRADLKDFEKFIDDVQAATGLHREWEYRDQVIRDVKQLVADLAAANKIVEAVTAWLEHDNAVECMCEEDEFCSKCCGEIDTLGACLRGEKPGGG